MALVALGSVAWSQAGPGDDTATVTATGAPRIEQGAYYQGELVPAPGEGELHLVAEERNPRVTPLPPHDRVDLRATVPHPNGTQYEIRATKPIVDDPLGRFGTWRGVGFDRWHRGRSGIGSPLVPPVQSDVAVFALADVLADGQTVATGVPVHAMTTEDGAVELDVGDPSSPVRSLPNGHLRVVWSSFAGERSEAPELARNAFGAGVLIVLLALTIAAVRAEGPRLRSRLP